MIEMLLDFEAPLAELRKRIEELEKVSATSGIDVSSEVAALSAKLEKTVAEI